jgi:hypothetical protein
MYFSLNFEHAVHYSPKGSVLLIFVQKFLQAIGLRINNNDIFLTMLQPREY